jgi:coenzyme F420-reducing hydrogenase beta subunit
MTPFSVEGTIRHPTRGDAWEYSIVVSVRNERGEEIARKVVDAGALRALESRTVSLAVDVTAPPGTTESELEGD